MFFLKTPFQRVLEEATSNLLLEPDLDRMSQLCAMVLVGDTEARDAVVYIKARIRDEKNSNIYCALSVLDIVMKNCGEAVHKEVITLAYLEELKNMVVASTASQVKGKILEMVQAWGIAFKDRTELNVATVLYNVMKAGGYAFPQPTNTADMFKSKKAPLWKDGDECFNCKNEFGILWRKHHCRACGEVFCIRCTSKQSIIPKFNIEKLFRVCDKCYNEISIQIGTGKPKSNSLPTEYSNSALDNESQEKVCQKCQKLERTLEAVQKYKTMMKELPEPVTDAVFEECHTRHQSLICQAYANIADEETLMLRLTESYETLKLENRQNSRPVEICKSTMEFYQNHLNEGTIYRFPPYSCKGKVLIINNSFAGKGEWERPGSEVDVRTLETLWKDLGFHVYTKNDLTAAEMQTSCREFAQNIGKICSVVVTIMSHGDNLNHAEFIYGNDKERVKTEDIITFFTNCPDLEGVPKVLMFQACRGRQRDGERIDAAPEVVRNRPRTPAWADMLLVYPSMIGHVAYRNTQTGSPLIKEVSKIFTRHAHDTDVLTMLTMVNNEVASTERQGGCVQMSNQHSYLRKRLFLFPGFLH